MLHITFSNQFETLNESLRQRLAAENLPPLCAQQVIIPSTAIKRALNLSFTDHQGICTQIQFSFLGHWLWQQMGHLLALQKESPFAPEVMKWRIFVILQDKAFIENYPRLSRYLSAADPLMSLELAKRIAQLIENYITYRPRFLSAWTKNKKAPIPLDTPHAIEDEAWQAQLWRRLSLEIGTSSEHPSVEFFRRMGSLDRKDPLLSKLAASAHVFCLPSMPPLYLNLLRELSNFIPIYLYVLNPSSEYWFEVVDTKRLTYLKTQSQAEHHEVGNELLASWGHQTQDFLEMLISSQANDEITESLFASSKNDHLLGQLQNSLLELSELKSGSLCFKDGDHSLQIHVCHSMTRELEVLQDQVLAMLARDPSLKPQDILVVTPNLAQAAPLIKAVFGSAPAPRQIGFNITGQSEVEVNIVARILETLIRLTLGRHPVNMVFDFLSLEPVRLQFDLDEEDLDLIRHWITESGIRWGLDQEERENLDLPSSDRHSFSDGINRLFIAFATGHSGALVNDRVGSANPEGQNTLTLGKFWHFIDQIRHVQKIWKNAHQPDEWHQTLNKVLDTFIKPLPEWSDQIREVRMGVTQLYDQMNQAALNQPLGLELIHSSLMELLNEKNHGGIPTGKLTFASISSLRNLPYRVICALGLNDGVYPSPTSDLEFDLMTLQHERGDRLRRYDERNQFLDLLLAARETLYLSYSGRSARDNSSCPPSVLVSELTDHVVRACSLEPLEKTRVLHQLILEHPLQAFSIDYFKQGKDPRKFSYNESYFKALQASLLKAEKNVTDIALGVPAPLAPSALEARRLAFDSYEEEEAEEAHEAHEAQDSPYLDRKPFFKTPLIAPGEEWRDVTLDSLIHFFSNPCRYLLRHRLKIVLPETETRFEDEEPFLLEWMARNKTLDRLLPLALEGENSESLRRLALAGNELPSGPLGALELDEELHKLNLFCLTLKQALNQPVVPHTTHCLPLEIDNEVWRLSGHLSDLKTSGLVRWRYSDVRAHDYLTGWIHHLYLCATLEEPHLRQTRWHSRDGLYQLKAMGQTQAITQLTQLMTLYREGLSSPLHFYPKSAWEYVTSGGDLKKAKKKWTNTRQIQYGEDADASYRLALRGVINPIDAAFCNHAKTVFEPLRNNLIDPRLQELKN